VKTREEIITAMCYTDGPGGLISMGLTAAQREILRQKMEQIFDNDIAPNMEFKQ